MKVDKPTFMPGDLVYLKDDVRSNNSKMNVDKILLQASYTVLSSVIEFNGANEPKYVYYIRPRYFVSIDSQNHQVACMDFEVCNRAEAVAMLRLIEAK